VGLVKGAAEARGCIPAVEVAIAADAGVEGAGGAGGGLGEGVAVIRGGLV